jgi:hypothetical protein
MSTWAFDLSINFGVVFQATVATFTSHNVTLYPHQHFLSSNKALSHHQSYSIQKNIEIN